MIILVFFVVRFTRYIQCNTISYPKIVWSYWDGGISSFVQDIVRTSRNTIGDSWIYNLLTPQNLTSYLNLSEVPYNFPGMAPALFSDFLRFTLLSKYGGLWMDTTTLLNSHSFLEEFRLSSVLSNAELVGFGSKRALQSCVIYAPYPSQIIINWITELRSILDIGYRNYVYKYFRLGVSFYPGVFTGYPQVNIYQVPAAVQQVVLHRRIPRSLPMVFYPSNRYLFKLHTVCNNEEECIKRTFLNKTRLREYEITKFNGWNRK